MGIHDANYVYLVDFINIFELTVLFGNINCDCTKHLPPNAIHLH